MTSATIMSTTVTCRDSGQQKTDPLTTNKKAKKRKGQHKER